jgi:hypothetical protein
VDAAEYVAALAKLAKELEVDNAALRAEVKRLSDLLAAFEWHRISTLTIDEVRKELLAEGYTEERLAASLAECLKMVEDARRKKDTKGTRP